MAATFVNAPNEGDNLESVVKSVEEKPTPEVKTQAEELPEKYRGKSTVEIARMHQEAEKLVGKQSQELGSLRSTYDQVIQATLQKQPNAPVKEVSTETQSDEFDEVEFFANPKQAVSKLLEKHPALQELRTAHVQEQQVKAKRMFAEKHPDAQEILQTPEFQSWVTSSKVRTNLLVQADQAYDVEAADELFSTWKQINTKRAETRQEVAEATQQASLKAGIVPTGASSSTQESGGKKIYRRADIIKLMQDDPNRYEMMSEEITRAYTEGRVR